jgi:hypothetical protein
MGEHYSQPPPSTSPSARASKTASSLPYPMCHHLADQYLEATHGVKWGKDARLPEFHGPF